jgi:hypothetical protein
VERYFSRWEFTSRYSLAASDAQSMLLRELLEMAGPAERVRPFWSSAVIPT